MKRGKEDKKRGAGVLALGIVAAVSAAITLLLGAAVLFYYFAPSDGGAYVVTVPDYVGKKESGIEDGGVFEIQREWIYSADVPVGVVISQTPPKDSRRKISERRGRCPVKITVSLGEKIERVPDVVGMEYMSAAAMLRGMGAAVRSVSVYDADGEDGEVVGCSPCVSERLDVGQTVTLYVKRDRVERPIIVPNVVGRTQESACMELLALGFTVGDIEYSYSADHAAGAVISQSLPPDIHVVHGTEIDLTVSLGSSDVWDGEESETDSWGDPQERPSPFRFFGFR